MAATDVTGGAPAPASAAARERPFGPRRPGLRSAGRVPVLCVRVEARLRELYGERLRGLVLYGSHARGEADDGSDVDLLVLLDEVDDFWRELRAIRGVTAELSLEHDVVVSAASPISSSQRCVAASRTGSCASSSARPATCTVR